MKALTIKQPWASLIAWGVKDIENRDWPTKQRGTLAIHSSARMAEEDMLAACDMMRGFVPKFSARIFRTETFPIGSILGVVDIVGCVTSSNSPWFVGSHGFALKNAVKFKTPIPCKGALGFWEVPEGIISLARDEYRLAKADKCPLLIPEATA